MKNSISLLFILLAVYANSQNEIVKDKSISFYNVTSIGIMPVNEKTGPTNLFTVVNGVQFKNRISVGLGFGIEKTNYWYKKNIPLFIEGRYSFTDKPNSLYFSMLTGYLLAGDNGNRNDNYGITAGASLGINVFASKHIGISTSIGYRYSHVVNTNNYGYGYFVCYDIYPYYVTKKETDLNRFELKVGFIIR
jgi:hypothetical protein